MFLSKFDATIDLDDGRAAIVLFCSQHHGKKEQHAIIAIELKINGSYQLYTLDFLPAGRSNDTLYGNSNRDRWEDKVREGQVRVRNSEIHAGTTREQLLASLHIVDSALLSNYRVGDYGAQIGATLIAEARKQLSPNSPKYRYSGLKLHDDEPGLLIFSCITWAKDLLTRAGIEDLPHSVFASLLESSGETSETSMGLKIPIVHTVDTGRCNIL